jgi:hypothetical protein
LDGVVEYIKAALSLADRENVASSFYIWGGAGLAFFLTANPVCAQGSLTVFNTGGGQPLVSQVRTFSIGPDLSAPRFEFLFGFGTDETAQPNAFLDSFTVTVQDVNQLFAAVFLTIDGSGLVIAPPNPGGLPVLPSSVTSEPIPYPDLAPVFSSRSAYAISAEIPEAFLGREVNVYFDFFDNQNPVPSQAWFDNLVVVPEPGMMPLGLLAISLCWFFRRRLHP